ncbi:BQ2448_81 [Microbotryum intermedium]|uniref:Mitochondrial fission 1 protein n=1 Tax=Microbotryum intermedium TaxID=269621 RepID=A0A238F1G8_9BASI|nr:BQ2448_81 [Microbotryum intermedium]
MPSDLNVLRSQYETEAQKGWVSVQTRFNYAWGSVKANDRAQVGQGVALLMDLYRTEPTRRRECLYFLAVGHYKLGNYPEAKRYNGTSSTPLSTGLLLQKEPSNMQARSLASLIDAAVAKEGYVGLAIAGGAVTVVGLLLTGLLSRGRKGR